LTQFNETEIHPVIFHEWLIHPDDDKIPFLHIDELTQSEEWKTTQKTDEHHRALTLCAIPGGLPGLAKEWFRVMGNACSLLDDIQLCILYISVY